METETIERAAIGGPVPGYYRWKVSELVRIESWGACCQHLEPIDPHDAAADGWSTAPQYRLRGSNTGTRYAVRVEITGRVVSRWADSYWLRGRVEFCGDGEPSTFAPCWLLLR
jgi:hypothetical protein